MRLILPQLYFSLTSPISWNCIVLNSSALYWVCNNLSGWISTLYIWAQWAKFLFFIFYFRLLVWRHRPQKHPNVSICSWRFGNVGCTLYSGIGQRNSSTSTKGASMSQSLNWDCCVIAFMWTHKHNSWLYLQTKSYLILLYKLSVEACGTF